ncbi:MAG: transcription elongation factor GreA [Bacteroidetes bacterium]|nr:transcription elongation factor GreA [Bacteroidota bacterium]MCL5024920.1 transcription elongation factor GreA [Chloroflexota bacterium]
MYDMTIADVAAQYIASLDPQERAIQQPEILRIVRWFGLDRPFSSFGGLDVEKYQAQVEAEGAQPAQRLVPFKALLTFAKSKGYLDKNLAKFVRVPRTKKKDQDARSEAVVPETVSLSAEGYAKLREELDHLVKVERVKVAQDLYNARLDKDIRENAGYDAAKQHQGLVEARIRELEAVLGHAEVTDNGAHRERAGIGSRVVVCDLARNRQHTYMLVDSREANAREAKISIASPVGKALLDRAPGEEVEVVTPGGKLRYRIERIES